MDISRRAFASAGVGSLFLPQLLAAEGDSFHFGIIADTHIIDGFYKGPEGNAEDTENIFKTSERLVSARNLLNSLRPKLDHVFLVGDYFHDYPSLDVDFYFKNKTRIDAAKEITDGFQMPVHVGFGNHDYNVPKVSREMSHELFRRKLGLKPYYSLDHKGVKFVHLNNFLGETWQAGHPKFNVLYGSLGEEQLNWFEAELRQHKPTFVFVHYPLPGVAATEKADYGLHSLVKKYSDTIQLIVSGHWHQWVDFGRTYGPPHMVMSSTRYDEDAYLVVEMSPKAATHRLLNLSFVDWNTHFSRPYNPLAKPNFTGEWKLNTAKSTVGPLPTPYSPTLTIDHAEPNFITKTDAADGKSTVTLTYKTDGTETPGDFMGRPAKSIAKWEGDSVTITTKLDMMGMALSTSNTMTLSPDGRALTSTTKMAMPQGQFETALFYEKVR
jgi:hypothetical protein